jgi:TRAP-type C4-dicarboxylate transport system permease small subunit
MTSVLNAIDLTSKFFGVMAALLVTSAIFIVCQMVALRYFLNESTVWQTEYVTYAIVAATFLGAPYVLLVKGHVNVDLLPHYLAPGPKKAMAVFASLIALLFCAGLAWQAYLLLGEAIEGGWVTDTIWELPLWIPYLPMAFGMFLLCVQYVAEIIRIAFDLKDADAPSGHLVEGD